MPQFKEIRRFANNVSEMKKLAARDYEDVLQVSSYQAMLRVLLTSPLSVPSQHSKVFSTSPTIIAS
jgi:hypothetical protein